jgi:hypothetical protein
MKKILLLLSAFFFINSLSNAQAPQGINYQGIARNSSGAAISKQNISVQISIIQGGTTTVYKEHQTLQTDTFGLYNLVIGGSAAIVTQGVFTSIPWSGGNLSAQIDIDPSGGSTFTTVSTVTLQSVPYALYAANSGNGNSGTVTSIMAGTGITGTPTNTITTSGSFSLAPSGVISGIYGSASSYPVITVDNMGRITNASSQPVSMSAGTVTSVSITPFSVINSTTTPLITIPPANGSTDGYLSATDWNNFNNKVSSITPAGGGITSTVVGNVYTLNVNNSSPIWNANQLQNQPVSANVPSNGDVLQFTGGQWKPFSLGSQPWTLTGNNVFTSSNTYSVGIGTGSPTAMLDIVNTNTTSTAVNINNTGTGYGINIQNMYNGAGASGLNIFHQGTGPALYVSGQNTGNNADILYAETHGGGNAIKGYTNGSGVGVIGYSHSNYASSAAVYGLNDSLGSAGIFHSYSPSNYSAALDVKTNGSGFSGTFSGGAGLQTDKIQITNAPVNGYVLTSDASGNATWQAAGASGVSSVTGTSPITSSGGTTPAIGITQASATSDGYLSSVDWGIFNGKGTVTSVIAGTGLNGGTITNSGTLSLATVGTPGTYGTSVAIPSITTDAYGRVVAVITNTIGGTLSGGTVNYLPKWTSATSLSSTSLIFDNGTAVGINNTTPVSPLDVASGGSNPTISSVNSGTVSSAGKFVLTGAGNAAAALVAATSGTGDAVQGSNTGTAGSAGNFSNSGASNTSPALVVTTGNASSFSGKFTGGAGLSTDKIQITGGAQPNAVLVSSNVNGDAIWALPANFSATGGSTSSVSGTNTTIVFGATNYANPPGAFNGSVFTASINGIYHFDAGVTLNIVTPLSGAQDFRMQIWLNGGTYREAIIRLPNGFVGPVQNQIHLDMQLMPGNTVNITIFQTSGQNIPVNANPDWTYFTGHIIH